MNVNELLANMKRVNFDMKKELQVKTYLPIDTKKIIAQSIILECTSEENGVVRLDSVQQYLSYVKYMITMHTNLEYKDEDYDVLCSSVYEEGTLLDGIISVFGSDAQECSRILNLMIADIMQENSIENIIGRFLNGLNVGLSGLTEKLSEKVDTIDLKSMLPSDLDIDKLNSFLNKI